VVCPVILRPEGICGFDDWECRPEFIIFVLLFTSNTPSQRGIGAIDSRIFQVDKIFSIH